jgi:hypothetical protein
MFATWFKLDTRVMIAIVFKMFFTRKYIKIIFFFIFNKNSSKQSKIHKKKLIFLKKNRFLANLLPNRRGLIALQKLNWSQ